MGSWSTKITFNGPIFNLPNLYTIIIYLLNLHFPKCFDLQSYSLTASFICYDYYFIHFRALESVLLFIAQFIIHIFYKEPVF